MKERRKKTLKGEKIGIKSNFCCQYYVCKGLLFLQIKKFFKIKLIGNFYFYLCLRK